MLTNPSCVCMDKESPIPILCSIAALNFVMGALSLLTGGCLMIFLLSLASVLMCSFLWWTTMFLESVMEGNFNSSMGDMYKMGMIIFICSEIMFFFSFFWGYFLVYLDYKDPELFDWPVSGVAPMDWKGASLVNTVLLLTSSVTLTLSHLSFMAKLKSPAHLSLMVTFLLGFLFMGSQFNEYKEADFSMNDGLYGSVFFVLTGFHGIHVIVGAVFLLVSLFGMHKMIICHPVSLSFELSSWYWHFVDLIWILLYTWVYLIPTS